MASEKFNNTWIHLSQARNVHYLQHMHSSTDDVRGHPSPKNYNYTWALLMYKDSFLFTSQSLTIGKLLWECVHNSDSFLLVGRGRAVAKLADGWNAV